MFSDMERFVSLYLEAMDSVPHIYLSALAWLPEGTFAYETLSKAFAHLPIVASKEPIWEGARVTKELGTDVKSVAYAPSGLYYAVRLFDEIHVWDARTHRLALNLISSSSCHNLLEFSPDGRRLASDSEDGSIYIWALAIGEIGTTLKTTLNSDGSDGSDNVYTTSLVFSLDGTRIASAHRNGCILIWDVESGNLIFNQDAGDGPVDSIAFSSDGKHIFSGSISLHVWDVDKSARTCIYTPPGDFRGVSILSCSRDGKLIAATVYVAYTCKNTMKLWNAQTYEAIVELGDDGDTACLSFTEDSEQIYHCSERGSIRVWSVETLELIKTMDLGIDIDCASFSPDLQSILTYGESRVSIFDIQLGVAEEAPNISLDFVYDTAVSSDSRYIASCHGESHYIYVWDAATGEAVLEPLQGHSRSVECVAFSNDGRWLVSGSYDHSVRIWDVLSDWACAEPLLGHTAPIRSVVISPDSRLVASCSWDRTARIWDISTRLLVRTFEDTCLTSFFPGSRWLAIASRSREGYIYDVSTGDLGTRFSDDDIRTLVVSPNGQWIAYKAIDSDSVCLWRANNGERRRLAESEGFVELKFTPDSLYLFLGESSRGDAKVSCWDVESGTSLNACKFSYRDSFRMKMVLSPDCKRIFIYDNLKWGDFLGGIEIIDLVLLEGIAANDSSERIRRVRWENTCSRLDGNDGWVKDDEGRLLMWVPDRHREDIKIRRKLIIGKKGCRTIRPTIDHERLMECLEKGWTNIYRPNVLLADI